MAGDGERHMTRVPERGDAGGLGCDRDGELRDRELDLEDFEPTGEAGFVVERRSDADMFRSLGNSFICRSSRFRWSSSSFATLY